MSSTVGVRELRQNLGVYLRRGRGRAAGGTERNVPLAELVPLDADLDPVERMIAEGQLIPRRRPPSRLPPRLSHRRPVCPDEALQEVREDVA